MATSPSPIDFEKLLTELAVHLPEGPVRDLKRRATDIPEGDMNQLLTEKLTLHRLAGIDLPAAIRGHNGNVKLLIKLMGDFGGYYGDAASKISEHLSAEAFEEAERLAHNLHGVAGSFGAQRLKEASKTLELAIVNRDHTNLRSLVRSFEVALTEVLKSADALTSDEISFRASDLTR
ncbi:MAG: Hpt domain-containing protein [Proteobacteria bacterium]|nr:Hpt domain-containing protein [Pseudomonadota bacterium]